MSIDLALWLWIAFFSPIASVGALVPTIHINVEYNITLATLYLSCTLVVAMLIFAGGVHIIRGVML